MAKEMTLGFILQAGKVLLIEKKRGLGAGKVNGFGGKVEAGEVEEQCIIREGKEELGIDVHNPQKKADLYFSRPDGDDIHVAVFLSEKFSGTPKETEEAKPVWFSTDQLPFDRMWADDPFWLPLILQGKKVTGKFEFSEKFGKLLAHEVKVVC